MPHRSLTLFLPALTLTACGMKGDLYLPPPPTEEPQATEAPEPAPADAQTDAPEDRGERRQIPPAPSPDLSR